MTYSADSIKALIIEDNEGDFIIIEELLEDEVGAPVITRAESLAEALSKLDNKPDLDVVLLDLTLPDASGEQLVRKILEHAGQIPVIVLTGYSDKSFGIKTLSWGVSDYLLKDDLEGLQLYKSISYSIERKKVYNQLLLSEAKYKNLFNLSPIPMWVFDMDTYRFLQVNDAATRNYGYTRDEFMQMTVKDIRPAEAIPELERANQQLLKDGKVNYLGSTQHRKKNGDVIYVQIESSKIEYEGVAAQLVLATDVTDKLIAEQNLRRSEEELRLLNAELEQRVAERTHDLTEANRQLEAFSYSISHDLQAPVRSMMGFAQLLMEDEGERLPEESKVYLGHIVNSARKMAELIKSLLEFSRVSKKNVRRAPINTSELVAEIWADLPKPEPPKVVYTQQPLPDIEGDRAMIEQVFVNLMANALKYSSKKEKQLIEVGCTKGEGEVTFYVKDNGAGFDMDYYDKLFGIFKRLHSPAEFEGTGVGLSIVKTIVEKHGGRIWAQSKPNEGATFFFTFPC